MSKLLKQILAVVLALQTSLSGISTIVHAEEPEGEPEHSAETITEEEETVLEETGDEENVIVIEQEEEPETPTVEETEKEEPPITEEPEITEEPQETETPEVTEPEETEEPVATGDPEITEAPEETEVPEVTEPEELETPAVEEPEEPEVTEPEETEEPWEEPEELLELDENDPFWMPLPEIETTDFLRINSIQYDSYLDDGTLNIEFRKMLDVTMYIVAIKDDVVWFAYRHDDYGGTYNSQVNFNLPAGEYDLRLAYTLTDKIVLSEDSYTLVVLKAPEVVGTGNFTGTEYAYIDLNAYSILGGNYEYNPGLDYDYILLSISKDEPLYEANTLNFLKYNQHDGIFRIELGDPDSYGGQGYYADYPYGSFDLRFVARGSGVVKNGYVFVSSDTTHVDITQDIKPTELYTMVSIPYNAMYYKGQTAQIHYWFDSEYDSQFYADHRYDGLDRRVTFKSSNPKLLKVDANGTVTVVGLPSTKDTPVPVDITVTSVADPNVLSIETISVTSATSGPASMKIQSDGKALSTLNWTRENQNYPQEVIFSLDGQPGMEVTFTVTGKSLTLWENPGTISSNPYEYSTYLDSEGKAHVWVRCDEGGVYKVNASTQLGKTASVTFNVDGYDNLTTSGYPTSESHYYVSGKMIKGWFRYDSNEDTHVFGKDVFKGDLWPSHQFIGYCDPKTGKAVTGDAYQNTDVIKKIDKKLYAFNEYGMVMFHTEYGIAEEGWTDSSIYLDSLDANYNAYVSKTGEVLTGWVNTKDEGWYYFDPSFGYVRRREFVPARNGKGMTYVDDYGHIVNGILVAPGKPTQPITDADGLYRIHEVGGDYFWVKDGAIYTGWLYLHHTNAKGYYWDTNNKNVLEKMYFDPNEHGAMQSGFFYAGNKWYYAAKTKYSEFIADDYDYYVTVQTLKNLCLLKGWNKYPEKYILDDVNELIIDANGAIVTEKLVKIAIDMGGGYETKYVYPDANGYPMRDTWLTVNGKKLYFNSNGWMEMAATYPTDWYYADADNLLQTVYYKLKNTKKPQEGYTYCTFEGKKLTSLVFYDYYADPAAMVDAKGNMVVNNTATVKTAFVSGSATITYIADANGNIARSSDPGRARIITAKGKSYIVDHHGEVQKNSTGPVPAIREDGDTTVYVMADKNGALVKKAFRTVSDSTYVTYKVWFDEKGYAADDPYDYIYYGNTKYYAQTINKKAYLCVMGSHYLMFVIPDKTFIPHESGTISTGWFGYSPIYLNKDGSIKTGFVKYGEHTNYILASSTGAVWNINGETVTFDSLDYNTLYKIDGKTYFFDRLGYMVTGWVHFDRAVVMAPEDYLFMGSMGTAVKLYDAYMYFDPKTGAAVTGAKKVLAPAVYDGEISLGSETFNGYLNNAKTVNTTSTQKTLNFDKNGVLIRDQQTKIGKKLTEVGADGVVVTGQDHWADANKEMYILKNGTVATGRKKIDGEYYYFDPVTGYKVTNELRKSGKKWYYYNEFGKQAYPKMMSNYEVTLPKYMQNVWGKKAVVYFGSTSYKDLKTIWNKDGSLAKIVYSETNKPAAGESISFGLWDFGNDDQTRRYVMAGLNGYVLDSKGLPMTGIVSGFNYKDDTTSDKYTLNVGKDGSKVVAGYGLSLVKIGKKYYVMHQGILYARQEQAIRVDDWSTLPASDQKTLNELAKSAERQGAGLYVMLNADGSVATNTKRYCYVTFDDETAYGWEAYGTFTSNKQGIILDLCADIYRVGKNCYISNAVGMDMTGSWEEFIPVYKVVAGENPEIVSGMIKCNGNKLIGFYDMETGKGLNGTYMIPIDGLMITWLKNGKPQTGNQSFNYMGYKMKFFVDPNLIGVHLYSD